jgi:cell wall-associated NlpC family hydrolase
MTPEILLTEARSWIGTPFEGNQCCKGSGVDCGQFLRGVGQNLGIVPEIKIQHYRMDFMLHRDEEWYKEWIEQFCVEVPGPPLPGDIVLYKQGRLYSHGGFVSSWPMIIHAYASIGVIEVNAEILAFTRHRPRKFFRPKVFLLETIS